MNAPIVVAYDGSDDSANAIASAGRLLAPRRALVVHAYTPLSRTLLRSNLDAYSTPLADAAKELDSTNADEAERLAAEGAQLAVAAGLEAQPIVSMQEGKAWQTITAVAGKREAMAIVTGARGRNALASALLGSTSNGLLHHSHVPVLIVPSGAKGTLPSGPALLCYDGSGNAKHAIAAASGLLSDKEALVLNLWESWLEHAPAYVPVVNGAATGMARELDEIAGTQSGELAEVGMALAVEHGFEAGAMSGRCEGSVWLSVLEAADECDASVIVLGSRGLSGISSLLGSASHGVVHHARRPVLVVPPAG